MDCILKRIALYTIIPMILFSLAISAFDNKGDNFKGKRHNSTNILAVSAPAVITGGAITLWDGTRCFSSFQMKHLNLVPKRWGPFQWADSCDIEIEDCQIQINGAELASSFAEIGKTLFHLGQSGLPTTGPEENRYGATNQGGHRPALVPLPPKIEVKNFSCCLKYPLGRAVAFQADLATFEPPHPVLSLEGNVRVTSGPEAALWGKAMEWLPLEEKIQVKSEFNFSGGKGCRDGRQGLFSMAGGNLKRLKLPKGALPSTSEPVAVIPPELMVAAVTGKPPSDRNNALLSVMCLALFQAKSGNEVNSFPAQPTAR
jgi:hypothetical protein